jgi:hypothetical protein
MKSVLRSSYLTLPRRQASACQDSQSTQIGTDTRWMPHGFGYGCPVLCAIGVLLFWVGVAGFVFSAVSPYDDDIQQEFFQQKSDHSQIKRIGNSGNTHVRSKGKIVSALLLIPSIAVHHEGRSSVMAEASVCVGATFSVDRGRSPPRS